jgi:hypothetical protein
MGGDSFHIGYCRRNQSHQPLSESGEGAGACRGRGKPECACSCSVHIATEERPIREGALRLPKRRLRQQGWMGERIPAIMRRADGVLCSSHQPLLEVAACALLFLEIDGCHAALDGVDGQDLPPVVDDDKVPRRSTRSRQSARSQKLRYTSRLLRAGQLCRRS